MVRRSAWAKNNRRELRKTMGRFLAMVCIVMLGVGFFTGLKTAKPAMTDTCNNYLNQTGFYDFQLLSSLGFGADAPEVFGRLEGVAAEGGISADLLTVLENNQVTFKTHLLGTEINQVQLTAGRMPQAPNEVLADDLALLEEQLGMELTVKNPDGSAFSQQTYVVVGLCHSPLYLNVQRGTTTLGNGTVSGFLFLTREGYAVDYFTEIYVRLTGSRDYFGGDKDALIGAWEPVLLEQLEQLGEVRVEELRLQAHTALAEARSQYDDGVKALEDGKAELEATKEDTYARLAEAEAELETAREELDVARAELEQGEETYAALVADPYQYEELAKARQELDAGWAQLAEGEAEYQAALDAYQQELDAAGMTPKEAKAQLEAAKTELEQGESLYLEGKTTLEQVLAVQADPQYYADLIAAEEAEVAEAKATVASYEAELTRLEEADESIWLIWAAETALEAAQLTLAMQEAELAVAQQAYDAAMSVSSEEIAQKQTQLAEARVQLDMGWSLYQSNLKNYEEARERMEEAETQLAEAETQLAEARAKLEEGEETLAAAVREMLETAREELDAGWAAYEDGESQYAQGLSDYESAGAEAEAAFAEAEQEIADGERELETAARELRDAELEIQRMANPSHFVLTPMSNNGFVSFRNDTEIVESIGEVFPLFFFLVAALVCSSTMTRMVEEQRTQNGTLKALGYSDGAIMSRFAAYAGAAAVLGGAVGLLIGTFLFPFVIWEAYRILYHFSDLQYSLDPWLALMAMAASLVCCVGAACAAVWTDMRRMPAQLMRPKAPKAGKRIWLEYLTPLWKHLRFLDKVTLRNIFRYRKRLIMMLLGTGGCLALLIAGLGLRDSISNVADDQFSQITQFHYTVTFSEARSPEQQRAFVEKLGDSIRNPVFVHAESTEVHTEQGNRALNVVATSDPAVDQLLGLCWEGQDLGYPTGDGAYLSSALAETLDLQIGDTLPIVLDSNDQIEVPITGIFENYVYHYLYMTAEGYETWFGVEPDYKTMYAVQGEGDLYEISAKLQQQDKVINVLVSQVVKDLVNDAMDSLNAIIVLVVGCAAALAFVVGYNLININITERIRELATVKVLGFYRKETHSYVFRESILLTVMGTIVGVPLGIWLHAFIMESVRVDFVCFQRQIAPLSYGIAVAVTLLVTLIVNWILGGKVDKIHMAESLKSVE